MLADWVVAQSKGDARVLDVGIDGISTLAQLRKGFEAELHRQCPGCQLTTINLPVDEAFNNQGNPIIVSAVRRDPQINYVVTVDGSVFNGLSTALASAGLTGKATIASAIGDTQNETEILRGTEGATTGTPNVIAGWMAMDAALRHEEAMSYPAGYGMPPLQLLTKANASMWKVSDNLDTPANYVSIFKRLWHVS
jgi:ribose transport system substrate-binding protein